MLEVVDLEPPGLNLILLELSAIDDNDLWTMSAIDEFACSSSASRWKGLG